MAQLTIDITTSLDGRGGDPPALTVERVVASPSVTHLRYRVGR